MHLKGGVLEHTALEEAMHHDYTSAETRRNELIRTDLRRTFPSLGLFGDGEPLHDMLHEVLHIYCALADSLPYQQGMSHLAAILLLHLQEPQQACSGKSYKALRASRNDLLLILVLGLYAAAMSSLLTGYPILRAFAALHVQPAIAFFDATLAQLLPVLDARLKQLMVSSDMFLTPWILTMFSRSLPMSTACRIWDRVLVDGEAELFRAALAIMQLLQPVILRAGFEEVVQLLTHLPMNPVVTSDCAHNSATTSPRHDQLAEAELLSAMTRIHLPKDLLDKLFAQSILRT